MLYTIVFFMGIFSIADIVISDNYDALHIAAAIVGLYTGLRIFVIIPLENLVRRKNQNE